MRWWILFFSCSVGSVPFPWTIVRTISFSCFLSVMFWNNSSAFNIYTEYGRKSQNSLNKIITDVINEDEEENCGFNLNALHGGNNNKNDKNCDKNDSKVLESSKNDVYIDINKNKNLNSKKKKKKSKIIIFNNINEDKTDIKTSDNKNINKNETKNITKSLSKTNIKKDDSNNNILQLYN